MTFGQDMQAAVRAELAVRHADPLTAFATIGWTTDQWFDTYQLIFLATPQPGSAMLGIWLRNPPDEFLIPISPVMVRDLFARHGENTDDVLNALAAGIPEQFSRAFLTPQWDRNTHAPIADGWAQADVLNLTEPQAIGWAATDYLGAVGHVPTSGVPALNREDLAVRIRTWIIWFGPTAYRYVLAGITLDEAAQLKKSGASPTDQQLRVMAALNGHTLPAGV